MPRPGARGLPLRRDGRPHFLEANPLAGLHPVLGDLVILANLTGCRTPS